jgi:hypothetical protein
VEEPVLKKKRTLKRDTCKWTLILKLEKGDASGFDDEEINHLVYQEVKKIIEQSGLCKLATFNQKNSDLHLWKRKLCWGLEGDTHCWGLEGDTQLEWTTIFICPLETRFGCSCQLRVTNSPLKRF